MIVAARLAALLLLIAIAFVTLSPVGLRPQTGAPDMERAVAYFLLGTTLAVGFPQRPSQTVAAIAFIATVLEALQLIDPGRDARIEDLLVKIAGGVFGILVARGLASALRRITASNGAPTR